MALVREIYWRSILLRTGPAFLEKKKKNTTVYLFLYVSVKMRDAASGVGLHGGRRYSEVFNNKNKVRTTIKSSRAE